MQAAIRCLSGTLGQTIGWNTITGFWCGVCSKLRILWIGFFHRHCAFCMYGSCDWGNITSSRQAATSNLDQNSSHLSFQNAIIAALLISHTILHLILRKGYKMNPISSCRNQLGRYIKLGKSLSDLDQYAPKTLQDWSRHVKECISFHFWVFFVFGKQLT